MTGGADICTTWLCDRTMRGQGIGRQLVEECMAALRAIGIAKAHIFVIKDNESGKVFWREAGWQERDDLTVMSRLV